MAPKALSHPRFGKLFFEILARYLPAGSKINGNRIAQMLVRGMKIAGVGFRSDVIAWLKGEIYGRHGLSTGRFHDIVLFLIKKDQRCLSIQDIESLIQYGREDYKTILRDPEIQRLRHHSFPPCANLETYIDRSELEKQIVQKLNSRTSKVVMLFGAQGRGKETLVRKIIQNRKQIGSLPVLVINASTVKELQFWLQIFLYDSVGGLPRPLSILLEDFRGFLSGHSVLLVLLNCRESEVIEELQKYVPDGNKILVSTFDITVSRVVDESERVKIPCFSKRQFAAYLRAYANNTSITASQINQLMELTAGNPYSLSLVTKRIKEEGAKSALEKFRILHPLDRDNEMTGLHRAIQLGYESLPSLYKKAFIKIGFFSAYRSYDLLSFQALWRKGPEILLQGEAEEILLRLTDQADLLSQSGDGEWVIRPMILEFARQSIQELDEKKQKIASQWRSTALANPRAIAEYQKALHRASKLRERADLHEKWSLFKSPLPHKTWLPFRALWSFTKGKDHDTMMLIRENGHLFTSQEMRYLELSSRSSSKSWTAYRVTVLALLTFIFVGILPIKSAWYNVLLIASSLAALSYIIFTLGYWWFYDRDAVIKRDLLLYGIWKRRIGNRKR